jgi:hypothetical protein
LIQAVRRLSWHPFPNPPRSYYVECPRLNIFWEFGTPWLRVVQFIELRYFQSVRTRITFPLSIGICTFSREAAAVDSLG